MWPYHELQTLPDDVGYDSTCTRICQVHVDCIRGNLNKVHEVEGHHTAMQINIPASSSAAKEATNQGLKGAKRY